MSNKPRSHAKKRKVKWGRVLLSLFLIVILLAIIVLSIKILFLNNSQDSSDKDSSETSVSSSTETETNENISSVSSITASKTDVYLIPNKTEPITLQFEASSTEDFGNVVWESSDSSIAEVDNSGNITGNSAGTCTVTASIGEVSAQINVTVRDIKIVDGVTYVDNIMLVNKVYGLPEDYDPGDTFPEVKEAFEQLSEAASAEGLNIYIGSGYRDYQYQVTIFQNYSDIYGEEEANTFSARPGHSEHQSGYTIDCNTIDDTFTDTAEGKWLDEHAHEYGFIIRYPEGKEDITGYEYESWHIRYVGIEVATEIKEKDLCLEEYLGVAGDTVPAVTEPTTEAPTVDASADENAETMD